MLTGFLLQVPARANSAVNTSPGCCGHHTAFASPQRVMATSCTLSAGGHARLSTVAVLWRVEWTGRSRLTIADLSARAGGFIATECETRGSAAVRSYSQPGCRSRWCVAVSPADRKPLCKYRRQALSLTLCTWSRVPRPAAVERSTIHPRKCAPRPSPCEAGAISSSSSRRRHARQGRRPPHVDPHARRGKLRGLGATARRNRAAARLATARRPSPPGPGAQPRAGPTTTHHLRRGAAARRGCPSDHRTDAAGCTRPHGACLFCRVEGERIHVGHGVDSTLGAPSSNCRVHTQVEKTPRSLWTVTPALTSHAPHSTAPPGHRRGTPRGRAALRTPQAGQVQPSGRLSPRAASAGGRPRSATRTVTGRSRRCARPGRRSGRSAPRGRPPGSARWHAAPRPRRPGSSPSRVG